MLLCTNEVNQKVLPLEEESNGSMINLTNSDIHSFSQLNHLNKTQFPFNPNNLLKNEINCLLSANSIHLKFTCLFNLQTFQTIKKSFLSLFKVSYSEEFFNDVYQKKYHSIIGIDKGNKEIICFSHIDIDKSNQSAKILTFGVLKEYQKKGIGGQLLHKVLEELMLIGIKTVSLVVQETNEAAVRLYGKNGFSIEKELNDYYSFKNQKENKALQMSISFFKKKNWFF